MTAEEELQKAADTGDLTAARVQGRIEELKKQVDGVEARRWVVSNVCGVAASQKMTPEEFKQFCEIAHSFITASVLSQA